MPRPDMTMSGRGHVSTGHALCQYRTCAMSVPDMRMSVPDMRMSVPDMRMSVPDMAHTRPVGTPESSRFVGVCSVLCPVSNPEIQRNSRQIKP
eukprot:1571339-Rhodomonas_salina.1